MDSPSSTASSRSTSKTRVPKVSDPEHRLLYLPMLLPVKVAPYHFYWDWLMDTPWPWITWDALEGVVRYLVSQSLSRSAEEAKAIKEANFVDSVYYLNRREWMMNGGFRSLAIYTDGPRKPSIRGISMYWGRTSPSAALWMYMCQFSWRCGYLCVWIFRHQLLIIGLSGFLKGLPWITLKCGKTCWGEFNLPRQIEPSNSFPDKIRLQRWAWPG